MKIGNHLKLWNLRFGVSLLLGGDWQLLRQADIWAQTVTPNHPSVSWYKDTSKLLRFHALLPFHRYTDSINWENIVVNKWFDDISYLSTNKLPVTNSDLIGYPRRWHLLSGCPGFGCMSHGENKVTCHILCVSTVSQKCHKICNLQGFKWRVTVTM